MSQSALQSASHDLTGLRILQPTVSARYYDVGILPHRDVEKEWR
jgi:hypothetical protein